MCDCGEHDQAVVEALNKATTQVSLLTQQLASFRELFESKLEHVTEKMTTVFQLGIACHESDCPARNKSGKDSVPPGGMEVKISGGLLKKLKIAGFALLATGIGGSSLWTTIQSILEQLK